MTGLLIPHVQNFSSRQFHQSLLKGILSPHTVLENLLYITGNGNYSQLVMVNGQKYLCSRAVSFYEEHLSKCSGSFLRVHKQCLINILHVKKYTLNQLIMIDGYVVPIARRRKKEVKSKMDLLLQKKS
jgi:DNA-binding LytR/AlgR family response regulator